MFLCINLTGLFDGYNSSDRCIQKIRQLPATTKELGLNFIIGKSYADDKIKAIIGAISPNITVLEITWSQREVSDLSRDAIYLVNMGACNFTVMQTLDILQEQEEGMTALKHMQQVAIRALPPHLTGLKILFSDSPGTLDLVAAIPPHITKLYMDNRSFNLCYLRDYHSSQQLRQKIPATVTTIAFIAFDLEGFALKPGCRRTTEGIFTIPQLNTLEIFLKDFEEQDLVSLADVVFSNVTTLNITDYLDISQTNAISLTKYSKLIIALIKDIPPQITTVNISSDLFLKWSCFSARNPKQEFDSIFAAFPDSVSVINFQQSKKGLSVEMCAALLLRQVRLQERNGNMQFKDIKTSLGIDDSNFDAFVKLLKGQHTLFALALCKLLLLPPADSKEIIEAVQRLNEHSKQPLPLPSSEGVSEAIGGQNEHRVVVEPDEVELQYVGDFSATSQQSCSVAAQVAYHRTRDLLVAQDQDGLPDQQASYSGNPVSQ